MMNSNLTTFMEGKHRFYIDYYHASKYDAKFFIFEESECDEILKTFNKFLNCTDCKDWSPKMVKKMPEFKFNLANTNGSSVNLELIDLITKGYP